MRLRYNTGSRLAEAGRVPDLAKPRAAGTARLLTAILIMITLVIPAAAQAAPTWLTPQQLSSSGQGDMARAALDPQGDALAVWSSPINPIAQAASRRAGGSWSSPPQQIFSAEDHTVTGLQLAVDGRGNAVAVWVSYRDNNTSHVVHAATRSEGVWNLPQEISTPGPNPSVSKPQVALDANGNAVAVWERYSSQGASVQVATRPAGGGAVKDGWSEQRDLTQSGGGPQVALDPQGNAVAVWLRSDGSNTRLQAVTRPVGGDEWSPPQYVSPAGRNALQPQVALDGRGNAVAVWELYIPTGDRRVIQAASRSGQASPSEPRGGWTDAVDLSSALGRGYSPQLALNPRGDAVVAWIDYISDQQEVVQAAIRPAGEDWRAAENVSSLVGSVDIPDVGLGPNGQAVAVWPRFDGANRTIEAATRPASGSWSAPKTISDPIVPGAPPVYAGDPRVALDAQDNALVIFGLQGGLGGAILGVENSVRAVAYDAAGPQLRNLTVPASGTAGSPLVFSVSPLDVWSEVASTKWDFGDGTSATGTNPSHTYAAPGTYQVRVTSTDTTEDPANTSTERTTVTITGTGAGTGTVPPSDTGTLPGTGTLTGPVTTLGTGAPQPQPGTVPFVATTPAMRLALRRCITRANRLSTRARRRAARIRCTRAGRPGGPRASAASRSEIILSFRAPGSVGRGGPPARRYVIKQSLRPIRSERDFGRALTLCGRTCAFAPQRRGQRLSLRITQLRSKRTYYYAVKAVGAGRRTGPRSETVRARMR